MKKLDLRTCLVMLAIFAVGYATCLALHPPAALALGHRLEVEELVADRIIAYESIESAGTIGFANGRNLHGETNAIRCDVAFTALGGLMGPHLVIGDATVISNGRLIKNVKIVGNSVTSDGILIRGLNADQLGGHPASDYVLWSDLGPDRIRPLGWDR